MKINNKMKIIPIMINFGIMKIMKIMKKMKKMNNKKKKKNKKKKRKKKKNKKYPIEVIFFLTKII
jgi:hypothetical protein